MIKNIYMAGTGGQGLQVAGKTLVEEAMRLGYNVTYSPKYGIAKRGGLTSCYLVISDGYIGNPRKKLQDILLLMEPKAYDLFGDDIKPGGTLLINSTLIHRTSPPPVGVRKLEVPLHDICIELGNTKVISSAVLGCMSCVLKDIFPDADTLMDGMLKKLKGKESLSEINRKAFAMGRELTERLIGSCGADDT